MKIAISGETDVGKQRDHNEDAFLILFDQDKKWQEVNNLEIDLADSAGLFFVIADGMGGTNAGEVASSIAVDTVGERIRSLQLPRVDEKNVQKFLSSIVLTAHNNIIKEARKNDEMKGMGTTMVLGWIVHDNFYIMWCGDSRCYIHNQVKHSQLFPFTEDHSLVWNRVKNGEITPEEARLSDDSNLILNALGDTFQKPIPDFKYAKLEKGDRILVCSDGLNSMLSDLGIQQIVDFNHDPKDACKALIEAANNAGGHDNITILVIDIRDGDPAPEENPPRSKKAKKKSKSGLIILLVAVVVILFLIIGLKSIGFSIKNYLPNTSILINKENIEAKNLNNVDSFSTQAEITFDDEDVKLVTNEVAKISNINEETNIETSNETTINSKDQERIKSELELDYYRINSILKEISRYEPGGDLFNNDFYLQNSIGLENIIFKLDSLISQIKLVADVKDNKLVTLKDPGEAQKFSKSLKTSVDNLNNLKEDILTTPL